MRKLIATVFNYSLDGLLADEGTEYWQFCFGLPENREPDDPAHLDFLQSAYAHIIRGPPGARRWPGGRRASAGRRGRRGSGSTG
jgi:hypothetical protein